MPRPVKEEKISSSEISYRERSYYSVQPWVARHYKGHSEIEAYVEASGEWETVMTIEPTSGASSEAMANYIVGLINQSKRNVLHEAMHALELVISDGLTFSSEQAIERAFRSLKRME